MTNNHPDRPTAATLQTPPGRGGIAVIALCGPAAEGIIAGIFRPINEDGKIHLGVIHDEEGEIDQAIVARTSAGFEINIHGGPHIARRVMQLLSEHGASPQTQKPTLLPCRHKDFNNPAIGKELLETLPISQSKLVSQTLGFQWSSGLSRIAQDGDIDALKAAADEFKTVQRLLNPPQIVLAGPPNAGKSTLANLLTQRNVSIVHETAGTTRDWIREPALINGIAVWITDTAGIWEVTGEIDIQAVQRARRCANEADLVLMIHPGKKQNTPGWLEHGRVLNVASKCDVTAPDQSCDIAISAQTGQGTAELKEAIADYFGLGNFDPFTARAFTQRQVGVIARLASRPQEKAALIKELLEG